MKITWYCLQLGGSLYLSLNGGDLGLEDGLPWPGQDH